MTTPVTRTTLAARLLEHGYAMPTWAVVGARVLEISSGEAGRYVHERTITGVGRGWLTTDAELARWRRWRITDLSTLDAWSARDTARGWEPYLRRVRMRGSSARVRYIRYLLPADHPMLDELGIAPS